jgi:hypothetical protein
MNDYDIVFQETRQFFSPKILIITLAPAQYRTNPLHLKCFLKEKPTARLSQI